MIKKWIELILNVSSNGIPRIFIHEKYNVNNEYYDVNNNNYHYINTDRLDFLCDISKIFLCYCDSSQHEVYGKIYYIIGEINHSFIFVRIACETGNNCISIIHSDSIKEIVSHVVSSEFFCSYAKKKNQKKFPEPFFDDGF
jgi:hypothetical protein